MGQTSVSRPCSASGPKAPTKALAAAGKPARSATTVTGATGAREINGPGKLQRAATLRHTLPSPRVIGR